MQYSRRDMGLLISALAATTAAAQEQKQHLATKAYKYDDMTVTPNGPHGSRRVLDGLTHTGMPLEVHITELGAGKEPHPPHQHPNEEMVLLQKGLLDVTYQGKTTRLDAGSVFYVDSNELHGWKNPGPEPAMYFVVALGQKAK